MEARVFLLSPLLVADLTCSRSSYDWQPDRSLLNKVKNVAIKSYMPEISTSYLFKFAFEYQERRRGQ